MTSKTKVQCRFFHNDGSIHVSIGTICNSSMEVEHDEDIDMSLIKEEHVFFPNGDLYRVAKIGPDYNNQNKTWKYIAYKSEEEAQSAKDKWNKHLHIRLAELSSTFAGMNRCIEIIEDNDIENFGFWKLLFTLILHPIRFPIYINRLANKMTIRKIESEINQLENEWDTFLEAYEATKYK